MIDIDIIVGHGGYDNGADYAGTPDEDDLNLILAGMVYNLLKKHYKDSIRVRMNRFTDVFKSIYQNAEWVRNNPNKAELSVSFHHNSSVYSSAKGTEVWHFTGDTKGKTLAAAISNAVAKILNTINRGAKATTQFVEINSTPAYTTSILIEEGFGSNEEELKKLRNKTLTQKCAIEIVNIVAKFLGLKTISEKTEITRKWDYENEYEWMLNRIRYYHKNFGIYRSLEYIEYKQKWFDENRNNLI
jgi:N-acetylmuramoyl-L-alanine amidase